MEEFLFIGEAEGGRKKLKSLQATPPEITASFLERLSLLVAIRKYKPSVFRLRNGRKIFVVEKLLNDFIK